MVRRVSSSSLKKKHRKDFALGRILGNAGVGSRPAPARYLGLEGLSSLTFGFALWLGLSAAAGGVLGSMLGLGGGIVIIPVYTLVLGLPVHLAIGASLVAVVANASAAATVYLVSRLANVRLALVLATATAAGALIGGLIGTSLAGPWLTGIFGGVLAVLAVLMLLRPEASPARRPELALSREAGELDGAFFDPASRVRVAYRPNPLRRGLPLSFLAGNIAGMLGLGGGVVQVPLMNLVMGLPIKAATATSSHIISLTAMAAAVVYLARGFVDPVITAVTVLGVYLGARTGARLAQVLPDVIVKRLFSVVLFYFALRMLGRSLGLPFS
jgi:uncharacterized membrane protein YfcA